MQTLKFLGRGSAFNVAEGNTSAYIKDNDTLLLIDCGENIFERIINKKLLDDVKDVHVLITHLNSDHVGSLSSLIYYCYYIKKIKVNVYFENIEKIEQLLLLQGNLQEQYDIIYKTLIDSLDLKFKSFYVDHINIFEDDYGNKYSGYIKNYDDKSLFDCCGYLIEYKGKKIYYSGDSCYIEDKYLNDLESNKIDEFYQDTSLADYPGNVHLSLRLLCEIISSEVRNKVFCTHIDNVELIEKAKAEGFNVVEVDK